MTSFDVAMASTKDSEYLKQVIQEAKSHLPANFFGNFEDKIKITEVSLASDKSLNSNLCNLNEDVKFGLTKKNSISISSRLIELAQTNKTIFNCGHKTFKDMLKAVLIHELTHVKDNHEKISLEADFQRIVGVKKVRKSQRKKLLNQNVETSPDAYEFTNLKESLAVNVEYLALDPEFECRKPATANYLAKRLGFKLQGECQKNYKVVTQSAYLEDNYQVATSIDPKRIYQVHYLFAGKGQSIMSRWGHAMFRLVVCAPFRKTVGPECMDDVSHHLALSYRAHMSDINISYAKGMFGKYPSQLFIMRYLEVQQEYTKTELRDLYSVPLKMTKAQKEDFIDLTLERFWTYQGKYYFLDNNCGTETAKHLAVALSDEDSDLIGSVTPLKIYNDIVKNSNDLTEGRYQNLSRVQMVEEKLLVESQFNELNSNYQFLRPYLKSFKEKNLLKFIKKTKAQDRLVDYQKFMDENMDMEPVLKKQVVMKLVYVERYLSSKFLQEIPKKALKLMDKDKNLKAEVMKMGESLKILSTQPWEVIDSHYGAPTSLEFEEQFKEFQIKRKGQVKMSMENQMSNLQAILGRKYFADELAELEELKQIKSLTQLMINQSNVLL